VDPDVLFSNSWWFGNGRMTKYDAGVVEIRRRMSRGLLLQGSYEWAKAMDDAFASSAVSASNRRTLRSTALDRGRSPWDLTHSFKVAWIYELPFGAGRTWSSSNGFINKALEGWEFHGTARMNSGRPTLLTSGRLTVNQNDAGVRLRNMDLGMLADMGETRKENGLVYLLPQNVIDNTLRAMGLLTGTPEGKYIGPPTEPGQWGGFVFVNGPPFARADISLVKRTFVTETMNVEFRAEFLNAFNNINFMIGSPANDVQTFGINSNLFGQTSSAYQDLSTTNDPGGRMVQFVLRFNF